MGQNPDGSYGSRSNYIDLLSALVHTQHTHTHARAYTHTHTHTHTYSCLHKHIKYMQIHRKIKILYLPVWHREPVKCFGHRHWWLPVKVFIQVPPLRQVCDPHDCTAIRIKRKAIASYKRYTSIIIIFK